MAGLAVATVTAPRASGQEACSCTQKDPLTEVELQITATSPEDHSRIGPDQGTLVIDLRGEGTVLVGDAPPLLQGVDLAEVPVLMTVGEDGAAGEDCRADAPPAGADVSLTGHVYEEETGPVVWTGPCQGALTVEAAATAATEASSDEDAFGHWLAVSAVVLAGLAILCLALLPLNARRLERRQARPPDA
jgi:hypothetical protein